MITQEALNLAAVVLAHGNPRCNVLATPHAGNVLVAYSWATRRMFDTQGREHTIAELCVDILLPTNKAVALWLGY